MPSILDMWQKKEKPTRLTPVRAMRAKCLDCTGNQSAEVKLCPAYSCPLWPYRMGRKANPPEKWEPDA